MYNTSVACPGEAVLFTCSMPGTSFEMGGESSNSMTSLSSVVQTDAFFPSQVSRRTTVGSDVLMFEAVLVSGTLMSTLINLSQVSVLDSSNEFCYY